MLPPDDIVALILGIFLTVRKLDVAKRQVDQYGHVTPEQFEAWKEQELNVYRLAGTACFLKVTADVVLRLAVDPAAHPGAFRVVAGVAFFGWVAALVSAAGLYFRARRTRQRLRIVLVAPAEPARADDESGDD